MAISKHDNVSDRGAGSGVIRAGSVPIRRGVWDLYETTHPLIGLFERCYWIELSNMEHYLSDKEREKALEELANFFKLNIKDNLIMLDYSHLRIMGGVSINAGESYLRDKKRKSQGIKDKFADMPFNAGYELRFSERDAVTFLALWRGYETNQK